MSMSYCFVVSLRFSILLVSPFVFICIILMYEGVFLDLIGGERGCVRLLGGVAGGGKGGWGAVTGFGTKCNSGGGSVFGLRGIDRVCW